MTKVHQPLFIRKPIPSLETIQKIHHRHHPRHLVESMVIVVLTMRWDHHLPPPIQSNQESGAVVFIKQKERVERTPRPGNRRILIVILHWL